MKIKVDQLKKDQKIQVLGHESWLEQIYASFPVPIGAEQPLLVGEITVGYPTSYDSSDVLVSGHFKYQPYVSCSRCERPFQWQIEEAFNLRFVAESLETEELSKERVLSKDELDQYFYRNDQIDLEELLNEQIQLAIPIKTVPPVTDGDHCGQCLSPLGSAKVYSTESQNQSPFAVLANLSKLKADKS